jgi:hypothetical protein
LFLSVVNQKYRLEFQRIRNRKIKKALDNKLEISENSNFKDFWQILTENLTSVHKVNPVHSIEEIKVLKDRFQSNIRLFTCNHGEELLGGVMIFESEKVAHAQYIATSLKGRKFGALDLLLDRLLNGIYKEKDYFDFGISNEDNGKYLNLGLISHKEGFGARSIVHDHYLIDL